MNEPMDTETLRRIIDLIIFQQRFKTNPQNIYEKICEISKRMEKTENVNQTLRDENQKLTSTNETLNTTNQTLQRKILTVENQLKKSFPTPFTTQRNPKFFDPKQFGGTRDELELFKFNFKTRLQANGDWYPTDKKKFNYAFSRLKNFVQGQIFPKMNFNNVLKINTVEKLLQCFDVNFGDHNKKQTVQNKINVLKQRKRFFHEYLVEFQKHINDTGYDVANQKYCLFAGMQWELNMLLVQHDTDLLTFDEMVKLSTSLAFRAQLVNQNRLKNYSAPLFNNIYASLSASTTMNTIPTQHQVITTYTNPPHFQTDQNDPMDLSAANRGFKKPLTAEQKKYRFENNLCLYCGKSGHKAFDYKFIKFTQRINFVSETFTHTPLPPAQLAIEGPPAPSQGKM